MYQYCQIARDGHVLTITLNRPEVHNSLNAPACFELDRIFNDFEADPDLWIAIITGAGERAFCAGHDLADAPDAPMPESGWAALASRSTLHKPLIAAVNGLAYGGGFEIALACDLVIAARNATFAMSEPRVGAVALGGGVQRLAQRLPRAIAMGMLLTGRRVDAAEAERWGLVTELVANGEALHAARCWADSLLECAPLALRHTKRLALETLEGVADSAPPNNGKPLAAIIAQRSEEISAQLFASADTREGIAAFLEKRRPQWQGR